MFVDELECVIIGEVLIEVNDILIFLLEKVMLICVVSGEVINYFIKFVLFIFGGSVDLLYFMMIDIKEDGFYVLGYFGNWNIYFGVCEYVMGVVGNGMVFYGGVKLFVSIFFVFNDYLCLMICLVVL